VIVIVVAAVSAAQVVKIVLMVVGAIIALSLVVIVHELGHFISARKAGVKVEAFSVGFGPKIRGIKRGETEYRLSLLLFGGYVKMKGMEPEEGKEPHEIEGGFFAAKPERRALIAFAAPLMNVLLALAVFTLLWFTGTKVPKGALTTTIGYLEEDSPARKAGLVPGDAILKVNGQPVEEWADVIGAMAFSTRNPVDLTASHNATIVERKVFLEWDREAGFRHPRIYRSMEIVVSEVKKGSLAEKLRLRKGDRLLSLAGERIYHIQQFGEILRDNIGKEVSLVLRRTTERPGELTISFTVPPPEDGIEVAFVEKGSSAAKARLKRGDIILRAARQEISTIRSFREVVNKSAGKRIKVEVMRAKTPTAAVELEPAPESTVLGAILQESFPILGFIPDELYGVKKENPLFATYSVIRNVVLTLKGLMSRTVSAKGISGPVGIVGWIAKSISVSFTTFLYFIGFISANFAVLNLLPIPIFDGGHIMFSAVEKIRGKPVRQRTMTAITNAFFVLIVAFFLFVTRNDVMRFFSGGRKTQTLWLEVPGEGAPPSTPQQQNSPPGK